MDHYGLETHQINKKTFNQLNYEINYFEVNSILVVSGFHSQSNINNCEYVFWYDRTPKSKVVTSNKYFVLDIKEMLCSLQTSRFPVIVEVTDLDYQNQTWIKADHVKHLITVVDFENSPKSIIVLIKIPIYYSFEFEITNGICQNNCTICKINSQSKSEVCMESSKSDPVISSDGEASNFNATIIFKCVFLYFIVVGLIISLIFVIIWIKRRLLQQILSQLQPSESNNVNPVIFTNEVTGIELNIDPFKDFTKTSFKSSSFVKDQESNKQLEMQRIVTGEQS